MRSIDRGQFDLGRSTASPPDPPGTSPVGTERAPRGAREEPLEDHQDDSSKDGPTGVLGGLHLRPLTGPVPVPGSDSEPKWVELARSGR